MAQHSVAVLMSTYNGAAYLKEQIDSLLSQTGITLDIFVRDDGSTDDTYDLLMEFEKKYHCINVKKGSNIGYKKSFLQLITSTPDSYDYYCFADQDDVWDKYKICAAIKEMQKTHSESYVSALEYVDSNLNHIRKRDYPDRDITLNSVFCRMRYAGCTLVFSKKIFEECKKVINDNKFTFDIPHDQYVLSICLATHNKIFLDHNTYIKYRRTGNNITAGGKTILDRVRYELNNIIHDSHLDDFAKYLTKSDNIRDSYLMLCEKYKENLIKKLQLIKRTFPSTGNFLLGFEASLKILLGTF
ncbi:glycosyltransferase [Bifidobacterium felsineum]|uniref:glycosyltransferase n=1 Tax=Bifidobacterium felsineum TaxID=2045440 RepID=UPI001BDC4155|nr:glycosyltransferase [Bifidobacterium felsineum]MBT1164910.1 glycosyltransferase [Bifidobacterium felsineum]